MSESGVSSVRDVALIVGGGPGISSSCATLFSAHGMRVGVAARKPDKPELQSLKTLGVHLYACDASDPSAVEHLFHDVTREMGVPRLVIHNIDGRSPGILRKAITEAEPSLAFATIKNAAFSAFLVGQQAAPDARKRSQRRWRARRDHIHKCKCGAQRLSAEWSLRHGVSRKGGTGRKHGAGTDAEGHSRRQRSDRRCDRLHAARWNARPSPGRDDRGRQHGRSGSNRRMLSSIVSSASIDMGL